MINNITKLREIQLELLRAFLLVCESHGLKWYAFFGTLLGVQRNQGYLPWDDDVDVAMPMEDYLILCEHREWFDTSKYLLQIPQDYGLLRFAHLCKNGTTAFRGDFIDTLKEGGCHGISIDIVPLAELPGMGAYHTPTITDRDKKGTVYLKEWFEPSTMAKFEDLKLRVPARPRKILTETYGDWAWPHGARWSRPSFWFFDTEIGYEYYVRRYTGMLEGIGGKRIYLFGASDTLRIWLERFNLRKQVVCTFDNDEAKWGKEVYGIEVKNPALLRDLYKREDRIIIVSLWHQEIGKQLEQMGIDDYYVYLDNYYDEKIGNHVVRRESVISGGDKIPMWEG